MRYHRFLMKESLVKGELILNDESLVNQLKKVLRLSSGDQIILADFSGQEARAEILDSHKTEIFLKVDTPTLNPRRAKNRVTLYCALLKKENFDLVIQKATEIGVEKIVPLITARTIKTGQPVKRWEKIIKEAVEQSGRASVPEIIPPLDLTTALALARAEQETIFLFDPTGDMSEKLAGSRTGIFIGPEGGFTDKEIALAHASGAKIHCLGPLTLRAETAALTASFLAVKFN